MRVIKKILIVSLLFILVTCSKDDGYGPAEINSGSSYSYNPPSSDYGSTSSTTTSVTQYSLTVTAGTGGSVSTSGGTYDDGSSVSITATPNDGYEFSGWNGSNSTNSTISVTINSNTIIEALFTEIPITETISTETTSTETSSTETTSTETTSTETTSTETTSTETTSSTYSITVTAQSSSNYILSGSDQNGDVSGNDPSVSAKVGDTLNFNLNSPGHPFYLIKVSNGGTDSNNLIDGVTNNGASSGTISWTPSEAGTYYYICEYHPSMLGTITITE
tara:strand:+ start:2948 stop:3778 length:831 start_codon:yes stop_codon:yes gene_type:complete